MTDNTCKDTFTRFIRDLQDEICNALENCDGKAHFNRETWQREGGGGGLTRVISGGNVFEKGGVNISEVYGKLPESMLQYLQVPYDDFFACGLSLVLHPHNPMVPTVHANFRYFELYNTHGEICDQWFAGGSDLTPYYLFEEDARHFHQVLHDTSESCGQGHYDKFKHACDAYFHNHHRQESRGVGGLFFDYLRADNENGIRYWQEFTMMQGRAFTQAYLPIVERRKNTPYTQEHKYWQEIRRGRYAEFNLIHDKGTLFGLKTHGRIESILMSLPPVVRWDYNYQPAPGSEEARLLDVLQHPKNWINQT